MFNQKTGRYPLKVRSRFSGRSLLCVFLASGWPTGSAFAGPAGELDATFGDNGRVAIELPAELLRDGWYGSGSALAEQPDGKLLVAGTAINYYLGNSMLVSRLNADGTIDTSFGLGGSVVVDFEHPDVSFPATSASALLLQPDGRIVIGGQTNGTYGTPTSFVYRENLVLVRLDPDGALDSTFGDSGRVTIDVGDQEEHLVDLALLPDGSIAVAGQTNARGRYEVVFARVTPYGSLDVSFGTGPRAGTTIVPSSIGGGEYPEALIVQPDGGLLTCGSSRSNSDANYKRFSAVRVFANGNVDTGFGIGGIARIDNASYLGIAKACLSLADGSTMLAGYSITPVSTDMQFAWLRPDGGLDAAHGQAGVTRIGRSGSEYVLDITALSDGSIGAVGTGRMDHDAVPTLALFARIDALTGQLDTSFGEAGVTLVDFGHGELQSRADGTAVIQSSDGKLVAVGSSIDSTQPDSWGIPDYVGRMIAAKVDPAGSGNAGIVSFVTTSSTRVRVPNAGGLVQVQVGRTGGSTGTLTVDYQTVAASATSPEDFTAASGTLVWADGETQTKTIEVSVLSNARPDLGEDFFIELVNPSGAVGASKMRVEISDNPVLINSQPAIDTPDYTSGGGAIGIETLLMLLLAGAIHGRKQPNRTDTRRRETSLGKTTMPVH